VADRKLDQAYVLRTDLAGLGTFVARRRIGFKLL
jgi:hypothetical protein